MKKHKSVVALLLAVMMVFTMMPMMAFADAPETVKAKAKFNSDYSQVTVPAYKDVSGSDAVEVPEKTYKTIRTYDDGVITATIDPKEANNVSWDLPTGIKAEYYDLSVAELADTNDKNLKSEYAFGTFDPAKIKKIKLNVPSYVEKDPETGKLPEAVFISFTDFATATKWTGKVTGVGEKEFDPAARTEQNLTVGFDGEYASTPVAGDIAILGNIPEKAVKINAALPDPNEDAKYTFDGNEAGTLINGKNYTTYYDGSAHTFAASEVSGWTVAYSTYDAKTGKWNPTTAVSLSDIQDKPVQVKASWTKAGEKDPDTTKDKTFNLNLVSAGTALVGFVPGEDGYVYSVPGTQYDASSYIDATPRTRESYSTDEKERAKQKFQDAALAKAVEANKAELIAYINELNEVNATVYKYNPNAVLLSIDPKDLTTKETTAVKEKYAALLTKFNENVYVGEDEAVVALNGVDLTDFEIEFTKAPAKKVIKTKKAKSTKKATINVAAECKNGTLVKYKLINAPKKNITIDADTGKITVKKGLAKGTYTFKVKAYIPASRVKVLVGESYYERFVSSIGTRFEEVQTIKVVVKKTKKK